MRRRAEPEGAEPEGQSPKAYYPKGRARRAEPGGVGAQSALGLYYYFIDRGFSRLGDFKGFLH